MHHFDALGMGRDRQTTPQLGWPVISLCRKCHQTAHEKGKTWISEEQHLVSIPLNERIAKKLGMNQKQRRPKK